MTKRLSKKFVLLLMAGLMVFSALACGTTTTTTTSPTAEATAAPTEAAATAEPVMVPAVGGELVYGSTTELSGDWALSAIWTNNAADNMVRNLINDYTPVSFDQGGNMVVNQSVCTGIDTVNNDDGTKTFTVHLAEDLVFNNGDPITAENYVAGILLFSNPTLIEAGSKATSQLYFVGGSEYSDGTADVWSGVRLIDTYTYAVTVYADKLPYFYDASYPSVLPLPISMWLGEGYSVKDDGQGCYFVGDMSAAAIGDKVEAARWLSEGRISAGPYQLVSFDKSTLQAVLEINPNYKGNFEGQMPHVQKLVVVKAEQETMIDALKTNTINLLDTLTGGDNINAALDLVDAGGYSYSNFERNGYGKLMFQCDFGPTQFLAVRQSVAYLLDRPEFANTFCQGYGSLVNGPYGLAMWMYKEAEEELNDKLNTYPYSLDSAVAALEADGWVLDASGNAYTSGIRYKEVTAEEAGTYVHNVTLADGRILMPLIIEWSSSEGNSVSELLATMLANNPDVATAGMQINQNVMTFSELLNYMYRDVSQGDQYGVPTYGMYNLATNFTPIYDMSYSWTSDPDLVAQGWNVNFLFDDQLDKLSMDMVYTVEPGDDAGYLRLWTDYVIRWNELLPEVPLYSNVYYTVYSDFLKGYEQSSLWDFENAIVYAWVDEVPQA